MGHLAPPEKGPPTLATPDVAWRTVTAKVTPNCTLTTTYNGVFQQKGRFWHQPPPPPWDYDRTHERCRNRKAEEDRPACRASRRAEQRALVLRDPRQQRRRRGARRRMMHPAANLLQEWPTPPKKTSCRLGLSCESPPTWGTILHDCRVPRDKRLLRQNDGRQ